jgi:hypothetical protein
VRILCSRLPVVVASGFLALCLGGVSGCGADKSDAMLEEPQIDADQKAEVKAQYQKQLLDRQSKFAKKGKASRGKK